eukprot:4615531-Alexandrium_andersonii.AAC.1
MVETASWTCGCCARTRAAGRCAQATGNPSKASAWAEMGTENSPRKPFTAPSLGARSVWLTWRTCRKSREARV